MRHFPPMHSTFPARNTNTLSPANSDTTVSPYLAPCCRFAAPIWAKLTSILDHAQHSTNSWMS